MTRYHKLILTFILAIVAVAVPQGLQAQESSSAYNWLNISSSSRIYGLGGMNISLVDFTIWLLGLLIAPVLLHFISPAPGSVGYMVCLYVVPLAFCVIAHYLTLPLRRRMKERDAAIGKESEND